jgi:hypothetical protein
MTHDHVYTYEKVEFRTDMKQHVIFLKVNSIIITYHMKMLDKRITWINVFAQMSRLRFWKSDIVYTTDST